MKHPLLLTLIYLFIFINNASAQNPFAQDDPNLEAPINAFQFELDVLANDNSGNGNPFQEVIGVCAPATDDADCNDANYTDGNTTVAILFPGQDDNNIQVTAAETATAQIDFKYKMQNSDDLTDTAAGTLSLTHFEVNVLTDSGSGGCDESECTLREAIAAGAADGEITTVAFKRDMTGTINLNSTLLIDSIDLNILGPGADKIIVSGNNQHRVFHVNGAERFFLSGITIADGMTTGGNQGAGVFIESSTQTILENLRITNNNASNSNGGGLYAFFAGFTLTNAEVSNNNAGIAAGGIGVNGGFGSDVNLENVTISSNTANNPGTGLEIIANTGQNVNLRYVTSANNSGNNTGNLLGGNGNASYAIDASLFSNNQGTDLMIDNNNVTNNTIVQNLSGTLSGVNNMSGITESVGLFTLIHDTTLRVHPISPDHPAYNFVQDGVGKAGCGTTFTSDQIGTSRPLDGACDVGAYEYVFVDEIFITGFE